MFSTTTRFRLKQILGRIAVGETITLKERIYIERVADQNPTVATSLRKAQRLQLKRESTDEIDHLLNKLELGSNDPQSIFKPKTDDLGEWFSGAPSWLARS